MQTYFGPLSSAKAQRVFFPGGEDPLSNVSAGIGIPATAESASRASARYHTQGDRHPGEAMFCTLLAGVACIPRVNKDGLQDFEVQ